MMYIFVANINLVLI